MLTGVDFTYKAHILQTTSESNMDVRRRWVTYEKILDEMVIIGEYKKIDEIKYRITDGENDKKVFYKLKKVLPKHFGIFPIKKEDLVMVCIRH